MGQIEGSDGDIAKLENQVANYKARQSLYFMIASQDGQVVQINKSGIGEILKDGENIGTIVLKKVDYVVEIYIKTRGFAFGKRRTTGNVYFRWISSDCVFGLA